MKTAMRLVAFAVGLGVVFAAAYGAGQAAGPAPAPAADHQITTEGGHEAGHEPGTPDASTSHLPGGLLISDRGYTLNPVAAPEGQFAFRITGPDGHATTGFAVVHDKRMHLIVARRDLSGFQHVHPEMDSDGTWRAASPLGEPGSWRVFADFTPVGGEPLTLGADVHVPGAFAPRPLPGPETTAVVEDYTVTLDGTLDPGRTSTLTLNVSRGGAPVTDLQPYLGAYGHLVALRAGDLAYLHVHPEGASDGGTAASGPQVTFSVEVPSAGTYRLYLDFQHAGAVRTAELTVVAGHDD